MLIPCWAAVRMRTDVRSLCTRVTRAVTWLLRITIVTGNALMTVFQCNNRVLMCLGRDAMGQRYGVYRCRDTSELGKSRS